MVPLRLQPVPPLSFSPYVSVSLHSSSPALIPPSAEPLKALMRSALGTIHPLLLSAPPSPSGVTTGYQPSPANPVHCFLSTSPYAICVNSLFGLLLWASCFSIQRPLSHLSTRLKCLGLASLTFTSNTAASLYSFPILSICVTPKGILDIFIFLHFPHPITYIVGGELERKGAGVQPTGGSSNLDLDLDAGVTKENV